MNYTIFANELFFRELAECAHSKDFLEPPEEMLITEEVKVCGMTDLLKSIYTLLKQKVPVVQKANDDVMMLTDENEANKAANLFNKVGSEAHILEQMFWFFVRRAAEEAGLTDINKQLHVRRGFIITTTATAREN